MSLGAAVEEAQGAGFAEADPTLDLNGTPAAQQFLDNSQAGPRCRFVSQEVL